jgi:hypothetical protein
LISDSSTLEEAKRYFQDNLEEGLNCPCCSRWGKVYRWSLYRTAIKLLVNMYEAGGTTKFVETRSIKGEGQGDASRLRHWGLAEQESKARPDGGKSGFWRCTDTGEAFLLGDLALPKYVHVYNGEAKFFSGPEIKVEEALGLNFNYNNMMA